MRYNYAKIWIGLLVSGFLFITLAIRYKHYFASLNDAIGIKLQNNETQLSNFSTGSLHILKGANQIMEINMALQKFPKFMVNPQSVIVLNGTPYFPVIPLLPRIYYSKLADKNIHSTSKIKNLKVLSLQQPLRTNNSQIPNSITTKPMLSDDFSQVFNSLHGQNDAKLVQLIRDYYIFPPSTDSYKLKEPWKKDYSMGQNDAIRNLIDNEEPGFFVECGALDGETRSNTLFLEREWNWKGLLVEADSKNFALLLGKKRKAYSINACLSQYTYATTIPFVEQYNLGHIQLLDKTRKIKQRKQTKLKPCFPLYSIMLALNRTVIDYFSLDVEGSELDVLQSIPFDELYIKVISVEYLHVRQGAGALHKFMTDKGFIYKTTVKHMYDLANDFIYYNKRNKIKPL